MKKILIIMLLATVGLQAQTNTFDVGEWFKFRIHYGLVNAGYATLEVKEATRSGKKVFHAVGNGYTTGMTKFFFKVNEDRKSVV